MHTEHYDVVVIGGGQVGLAIGYHLAQQGRRFTALVLSVGRTRGGHAGGHKCQGATNNTTARRKAPESGAGDTRN